MERIEIKMPKFFVKTKQINDDIIVILDEDVNHIKNVLRMKADEKILVSNGLDKDFYCSIESIGDTEIKAKILDIALILHAEHGGGNNSSFTTHVVTSSGTDTYSAISAALGSLKGPKHGGANNRVMSMMEEIQENVKDWSNDEEVKQYLIKILKKDCKFY